MNNEPALDDSCNRCGEVPCRCPSYEERNEWEQDQADWDIDEEEVQS